MNIQKLIPIILLILQIELQGQSIAKDKSGKDLFVLPSMNQIKTELSLTDFGFEFNILRHNRVLYYYGNSTDFTMAKSSLVTCKIGAISNDESILLIDKNIKLEPSIEIGWKRGFDSLINPSRKGWYNTRSIAIFGRYQDIKEYNKNTNPNITYTSHQKFSPGGKVDLNLFYKTYFALAFTGSYQYHVRVKDLTSVQERVNVAYIDNNVVSNGDVDGYIGPIRQRGEFRFSGSVPIFLPKIFDKIQICFIPNYYLLLGNLSGNPSKKNHIGGSLSFIPENFYRFDRNSDNSYNPNSRYTFAGSFNIGYEFSDNGTKQHQIFIGGAIPIGQGKFKKLKATERD